MMKFWLLAFVLAALSCSAQVTAIRAGHLVDVDAGVVLADQTILIRDGKIEAVGKGLAIPAGANVIDLSSMTVLPGLIDCHTHLADGVHDTEPLHQTQKSASQVVLESVPNARVSPGVRVYNGSGCGRVPCVKRRCAAGCDQSGLYRRAADVCGGSVYHHYRRGGCHDGAGSGLSVAAGYAVWRSQ